MKNIFISLSISYITKYVFVQQSFIFHKKIFSIYILIEKSNCLTIKGLPLQ